jgi:hypothetical protein
VTACFNDLFEKKIKTLLVQKQLQTNSVKLLKVCEMDTKSPLRQRKKSKLPMAESI